MKREIFINNEAATNQSAAMESGNLFSKLCFALLVASLVSVTSISANEPDNVVEQQTDPQPRLSRQMNWVINENTGELLNNDDLRRIMQINPAALQMLNKGLKQRKTGMWIALPATIPLGVGFYWMLTGDGDLGIPTFLVGGGVYAIGMVVGIKGRNKVFQAADIYNSGLSANKPEMELIFGFTGNGVGLALRF